MMRLVPLLIVFALIATPAHAGPVAAAISAISTWVGGVLAAGGAGAFFLRMGASIALSMLSMALAKKKSTPSGIKTEGTASGGTTPQKFILGLTATGGQLIAPPMSYTHPGQIANSNLIYAVALSVVPGCTLQRLIVDDAWVPLGAPVADGWGYTVTGALAGRCRIDFLDGSQTGAHPGLMAQFAADPDRPWSADMVGPGTCYAVLNFGYSREHFNGLPQCRYEVMGIPVYDPRADSSVGGSGTQRWNNRATWSQSANLAVLSLAVPAVYANLTHVSWADGVIRLTMMEALGDQTAIRAAVLISAHQARQMQGLLQQALDALMPQETLET